MLIKRLRVDAIVCIDACFTQKRRKSQGNAWQAPHSHPETFFIPVDELKAMEEKVEQIRPSKTSNSGFGKGSQKAPDMTSNESDYEPGIKVPVNVLNECHESFKAADEKRTKASTTFFADTGLMALLCRHDRVLWLANMTSAGEKQHYVLSLLQKLIEHIPLSMRLGVLYDIGCLLHHSCQKFDFLGDDLNRIIFAISVFHAFGHQWACQIIYHPRKCLGFGMTDGEGCERFWGMIDRLIPSCRVSGYYTRLYTIDTKVKHLDIKSLLTLGSWLRRKWINAGQKKINATEILSNIYVLGFSEVLLRKEWEAQVIEQTKPLKRQSKNLANKEITDIMTLLSTIEDYKVELDNLNTMIESEKYSNNLTFETIYEHIESITAKSNRAVKLVNQKKNKLSIDENLNLKKLMGNQFLRIRMNALALKQRIRDRLRQRKFELDNLERDYHTTVNHAKLSQHAQQSIKKKEPGLQALAKKYNNLCLNILNLIENGKAPKGAVAPSSILLSDLYNLDVDDDIWLDIGLTDENDELETVPGWLGNENIRRGIKALLEQDRCNEEMRRLIAERLSLQQWMREEWIVLLNAIEISAEDQNLMFLLLEHKRLLLRLCLEWEKEVRSIPCELSGESWGPTLNELEEARDYEYNEMIVENNSDLDDSDFSVENNEKEMIMNEIILNEMEYIDTIDTIETDE